MVPVLILAVAVLTSFLWHALGLAEEARPIQEIVGYAAFHTAALFVIALVLKIYATRWAAAAPSSHMQKVVEHAIAPIVALIISTRSGCFAMWFESETQLALFVLAAAALSDPTRYFHKKCVGHFLPRESDAILYLKYPPRRSIDLLPMHLFVIGLAVALGFRLLRPC